MLKPIFRIRFQILIHTIEELIHAPLLKNLTVSIFILCLVYLCYGFAHHIFNLLNNIEGAGPYLCDKILNLFFLSLFFLLIFSNAIASYSTIFKNKEISVLLVQPLSYEELFIFKFLESLLLTSWAFMVLIVPFISAYFQVKKITLFYLPYVFLYILPYIFITASLGTILTLLLIRLMPRKDIRGYLILILAILVFSYVVYVRHTYVRKEMQSGGEIIFFISELLPYFNLGQKPYLPSYWLSNAIILIPQRIFKDSFFYFWLLFINAIFLFQVLLGLVSFTYYNSLVSLASQAASVVKGKQRFWNFLKKLFFYLSPPEKELVIKDVKSIVRDPVQYFQILIFFGILAVYFTNLQGEYYQSFAIKWKIFIAFLNLTVTNLVLASLALRFVFPLVSLEGKRMWILNLSLVSRWKLLFTKFVGISLLALIINTGLITISNIMLKIDKEFVKISILGSAISSFTLIGITLSLGSCFPNFKEENPSRIIAGLGGTFTLIISLLYVGVMVFMLSFPFQLYMLGRISYQQLKFHNNISCSILFLLSMALIALHLYRGKISLERAEF